MISILRKRRQTTVSNRERVNWRKKKYWRIGLCAGIAGVTALLLLLLLCILPRWEEKQVKRRLEASDKLLDELNLSVKLLDINEYSRPGIPLKKVKGIVVHYTANPGTDAVANRNYFNNLPRLNRRKDKKTYASSHFIVGLDGTIVQCIPTEEISYASNDRNSDTISIECCHKRKDGKFTEETYEALLRLVTYLCVRFELDEEDVIRHYDVTGKNCPKYFVENEQEWLAFRSRLKEKLQLQKDK